MKKLYTFDDNKVITMKRASAEWFNHDCPDTYDSNGDLVFKYSLFGGNYIAKELFPFIYDFVYKSHLAFCKKYKHDVGNPDDLAILADIKSYIYNNN